MGVRLQRQAVDQKPQPQRTIAWSQIVDGDGLMRPALVRHTTVQQFLRLGVVRHGQTRESEDELLGAGRIEVDRQSDDESSHSQAILPSAWLLGGGTLRFGIPLLQTREHPCCQPRVGVGDIGLLARIAVQMIQFGLCVIE